MFKQTKTGTYLLYKDYSLNPFSWKFIDSLLIKSYWPVTLGL